MLDISTIELTRQEKSKDFFLPIESTKDLAYVCGVLAGDGNIHTRFDKHEYSVTCLGNQLDEREFYDKVLLDLFYKLFNSKIKNKLHERDNTYGFTLRSKSLVLFLTKIIGLPSGRKDNIKIPTIFLDSKEMMKSFIQGFADTDLCISLKRRYKNYQYYPVINGVSKSRILRDEIADFLESEGFSVSRFTHNYYDPRVKKKILKYEIAIYGHLQLVKWMQLIGFRHPKHLKKFQLWKERNKNNKRAFSALQELNSK
ncbi:MAG: hypothetical protein HYU56_03730 [Candidatus Aenigmarchaeota archaeon]|nr:hypothetical protein [Candidatus Aenigmarchaeota archaeon]